MVSERELVTPLQDRRAGGNLYRVDQGSGRAGAYLGAMEVPGRGASGPYADV